LDQDYQEIQRKHNEVDSDENNGKFILIRSMRVVSAMVVLECTLLTSYTAFLLRATILNEISQEVSLIMSVMTVFVASAEA